MKISSAVAEPITKTMSQQKWFNDKFLVKLRLMFEKYRFEYVKVSSLKVLLFVY